MRPYSQTMAGLKDALNLLCRESVGRTERAGWSILQAGKASATVALQPFPGGGAGDPYRLGSPGHCPPHLLHPLDQKKPTKGCELCSTMCHESLLSVGMCLLHPSQRRKALKC